MLTLYSAIFQRLGVAVLIALFVCACDLMPPTGPTPVPPGHPIDDVQPSDPPFEAKSCSASNNELELTEASLEELEMACLIINHEGQQRSTMHFHPTLGKVARARANDMAENGYYGEGREYPPHVDHDGFGPNYYLCAEGYRPDLYCTDYDWDNSVESSGWGGDQTPIWKLKSWIDSEPHRIHILGEHEYFKEANHYGIGHTRVYETDADSGVSNPVDFWIFIAAFPAEP